jgi:hypothetical protein
VRAPLRAAAPGDPVSPAGGPALERARAFTFTAADRGADAPPTTAFREHLESLYGPITDWSWLEDGPAVSYDDMVAVIARNMAAELAGVDLAITVEASPDCRHVSYPACRLKDSMDGEPLIVGVCDQGIAGPFTALRLAQARLRSGASRRAVVLIMEQSTLPPDRHAVRPRQDVAVALILGRNGPLTLGGPGGAVNRAGTLASSLDHRPPAGPGTTVIAGASLSALRPRPGVSVIRAPGGHPCAGVWIALADYLGGSAPPGGPVLLADRDPVLPYQCWMTLGGPAGRPAAVPELIR